MDKSITETADSAWKGLYKVGGAAALITAVLIPIQIIVFVAWPPPLEGTVIDWFTLFQDNWLLGLLGLDLLIVVEEVLLVPILLAFYVALRRASESLMAIATTLWLVGLALFIASNPAFEMLSLSQGYAAATTEPMRSDRPSWPPGRECSPATSNKARPSMWATSSRQ